MEEDACKHQRIGEFAAIPCLQEMSKATHKVLPTRVEQGQELFTCQWGPEKIQEASSLHKDACRNQEPQSRLTQGKRERQACRKEGGLRPRPSYWGCKEKVLLDRLWGNQNTSAEAAYSGRYYSRQADIETNHNRYLNQY